MRTEEMKKDKQIKESKEKYNKVVNYFKESLYELKDEILRDNIGRFKLYGEELCKKKDWEECKKVLDTWEIWEINFNILSPVEEEEPFNNLNYMGSSHNP
jgi:uncharacterized protein YqgQ